MRARSLAAGCVLLITAPASLVSQTTNTGQVTICVRNGGAVPLDSLDQAEVRAAAIFNQTKVKINWRCRELRNEPDERPIIVEIIRQSEDAESRPVASAMPYEGVHIRVFYDRIDHHPKRAALLAHVFVHEITHVLQGVVRHSPTGIMKARWTPADIDRMDCQGLEFTTLDLLLIQKGLEARARAIGGHDDRTSAKLPAPVSNILSLEAQF